MILTIGACGGEQSTGLGGEEPASPGPQLASSVAVTPSTAFLSLGETLQFIANAQDASGDTMDGKTFTWSSSDESIATVTNLGNVSALANGSVTITAATDAVEGTAAIEAGGFTGPLGRTSHAMAYDAESDRVILHGGESVEGHHPSNTWAYDFNTNAWTDMDPATDPDGRFAPGLAYDAQSDRVIRFGGTTTDGAQSDTWAFDFNSNNWTRMNPTSTPRAGYGQRMVYDGQSDRIIMFGGVDSEVSSNETYAYDFDTNDWTLLNPSPRPRERSFFGMAYDAESDRVILHARHSPSFGGPEGGTWAYDFNTNAWTDMDQATKPGEWNASGMAYDAESDRVILFGGINNSIPTSDTWAYDFNANSWTLMNPIAHPTPRSGHAMAYDEDSDRVILFGGQAEDGHIRGETWAYDFNTDTWTHVH